MLPCTAGSQGICNVDISQGQRCLPRPLSRVLAGVVWLFPTLDPAPQGTLRWGGSKSSWPWTQSLECLPSAGQPGLGEGQGPPCGSLFGGDLSRSIRWLLTHRKR